MDTVVRYFQALLSKTFELAFETTPLEPGGAWMIPLCGRELGDKRMYPHIHLIYVQEWGGQTGFALALAEGACT